ncbi:MAG: UDP-N-acetylmuramoyl-L-alanyl-D-glutamate--2,6-diaminopimelate ligase [Clostridium sp.]|nr:MAG: UDP-N-acetylmuramoyl-L-alanyl-D-glutamate--2,6-diaminopimelate ligase [Clostridium sp.]
MITIEKLFENVSYTSNADISKIKIKGIATDSRQVKDGDLFVCIKGKDDDGHKHALEAQMLGAVAILAEHATESGLPTAIVTNSRQSYSKICQNFFEKPHLKLKIVSIVGTNGKTTTSYIAEHLLKSAGYKTGVIGTIGYKILDETYEADLTTPDSFTLNRLFRKMVRAGVEIVVMEVSAHAIAQDRLYGITSDISIFTNVSPEHLDYFCDFSQYYDTKLSFFKNGMTKSAIVNVDDNLGRELYKTLDMPIISYGIDEPSDVFAMEIKRKPRGTSFIVNVFDEIYELFMPLYGKYNVLNALSAITLLKTLKVPLPIIAESLQKLPPIPGRFNIFFVQKNAKKLSSILLIRPTGSIIFAYGANSHARKKMITVFGCGGNRDKGKRKKMGEIAARLSDAVIVTEDNSRTEPLTNIISDIMEGVKGNGKVFIVEERREAVEFAASLLSDGDLLVVAGKGAEKYIERNGRRVRYSDVDEAIALSRGER